MVVCFKCNLFFAFRDAKDAVRSRDGYDYDGYKLRVEFPRGRERGPGGVFKGGRDDSRYRPRSSASTKRSSYRVKVTGNSKVLCVWANDGYHGDFLSGLPPSGSWQDLKDHMREAGDVCYADVFKDGSGVVEFLRYDDMRYALKKLNDSRFRSHEVCS